MNDGSFRSMGAKPQTFCGSAAASSSPCHEIVRAMSARVFPISRQPIARAGGGVSFGCRDDHQIAILALHNPGRERLLEGPGRWTKEVAMSNGLKLKQPGWVRGRPVEKDRSGNPAGRRVGCRHETTIAAAALLAGGAEVLTRKGRTGTRRRPDHDAALYRTHPAALPRTRGGVRLAADRERHGRKPAGSRPTTSPAL